MEHNRTEIKKRKIDNCLDMAMKQLMCVMDILEKEDGNEAQASYDTLLHAFARIRDTKYTVKNAL